MRGLVGVVLRGTRSGWRRLREEGLCSTLVWLVGRGVPLATGVPLARFSQVTPHLFVGSQHGRLGKWRLTRLGIDHVVSLREEFDDGAHGLAPASYCYLPTTDLTAPSLEQLEQGVAFIRTAIAAGGKVYVHCNAGVGRAPTLVLAYLVCEGLSVEEALARLRQVRPFIQLGPEQLDRLVGFAADVRARLSG
jgi:hypothetical protein